MPIFGGLKKIFAWPSWVILLVIVVLNTETIENAAITSKFGSFLENKTLRRNDCPGIGDIDPAEHQIAKIIQLCLTIGICLVGILVGYKYSAEVSQVLKWQKCLLHLKRQNWRDNLYLEEAEHHLEQGCLSIAQLQGDLDREKFAKKYVDSQLEMAHQRIANLEFVKTRLRRAKGTITDLERMGKSQDKENLGRLVNVLDKKFEKVNSMEKRMCSIGAGDGVIENGMESAVQTDPPGSEKTNFGTQTSIVEKIDRGTSWVDVSSENELAYSLPEWAKMKDLTPKKSNDVLIQSGIGSNAHKAQEKVGILKEYLEKALTQVTDVVDESFSLMGHLVQHENNLKIVKESKEMVRRQNAIFNTYAYGGGSEEANNFNTNLWNQIVEEEEDTEALIENCSLTIASNEYKTKLMESKIDEILETFLKGGNGKAGEGFDVLHGLICKK